MIDKKNVKYRKRSVNFGQETLTLWSIDGQTWSTRKDELLQILERQEAEKVTFGEIRSGGSVKRPQPKAQAPAAGEKKLESDPEQDGEQAKSAPETVQTGKAAVKERRSAGAEVDPAKSPSNAREKKEKAPSKKAAPKTKAATRKSAGKAASTASGKSATAASKKNDAVAPKKRTAAKTKGSKAKTKAKAKGKKTRAA